MPYAETTTDSNGCFQVNDVPIGTYQILAHKNECTAGASYTFDVKKGQTTAVDFVLPIPPDPSVTPTPSPIPFGFVRVFVTLQNGNPAAGCTVRIVNPDHSSVVSESIADDSGCHIFAHVPLGTYQAYAEKNSSLYKYSDSFTVQNHMQNEVNLVL